MTTRTEELQRDPQLVILPSGLAVSTAGIQCAGVDREQKAMKIMHLASVGQIMLTDPHDIAAMQAVLNRVGVYVEAPTLRGDDADGDGRIGESKRHAQP